jgi:hypothetical protein
MKLTILAKKIEEMLEFCTSRGFLATIDRSAHRQLAAVISGRR